MRILIDVNLGQAVAMLDPATLSRKARGAMTESLAYLQAFVQNAMPVDTGIARGTVYTEMHGTAIEDLHGSVVSGVPYVSVLEYGRKPGSLMPPPRIIEEWATRNIGKPGLGYVIARSIARKGLPEHRMFRDATNLGAKVVQKIWSRWFA